MPRRGRIMIRLTLALAPLLIAAGLLTGVLS